MGIIKNKDGSITINSTENIVVGGEIGAVSLSISGEKEQINKLGTLLSSLNEREVNGLLKELVKNPEISAQLAKGTEIDVNKVAGLVENSNLVRASTAYHNLKEKFKKSGGIDENKKNVLEELKEEYFKMLKDDGIDNSERERFGGNIALADIDAGFDPKAPKVVANTLASNTSKIRL